MEHNEVITSINLDFSVYFRYLDLQLTFSSFFKVFFVFKRVKDLHYALNHEADASVAFLNGYFDTCRSEHNSNKLFYQQLMELRHEHQPESFA